MKNNQKNKMPKGVFVVLIFIPVSIALLSYYLFTRNNFLMLGHSFAGSTAKILMSLDILFLIILFFAIIKKSKYVMHLLIIDSILPLMNDGTTYFLRILPVPPGKFLKLHALFILLILQSIALFFYSISLKKYFNTKEISTKKDTAFAAFYILSFIAMLILLALISWRGA